MTEESSEICTKTHTPCPSGYVEWHEWAESMGKLHEQVPCKGCGLLKVWVRKKDGKLAK